MDTTDSDLADDIVADRLPTHTVPLIDDFKPWHRVKKEFIRQHQWNELTSRLVKRRWHRELKEPDEAVQVDVDKSGEPSESQDDFRKRPLKCLVIPGDDLLDIRALWRDTSELECHIRYLGFNEKHGSNQQGTRVHVANNAVTSLPRVAKDSQVIADRFEQISSQNSQARRYLRSYGPYHVINLDFCGSIFPNTQNDSQPYYDAIHRTLEYQFEEQKSPWLLFITTEVQPSIADRTKLQPFCKLARDNFDTYAEFRAEIGFIPQSAFESTDGPIDLGQLTDEQITKLFGVSFGKWLLQLSLSAQPRWTIEMRRSFQYSINDDKGVVMLALAFEFTPNITPPTDESGISSLNVTPRTFADERECAIKIARSVASIQDVDDRLRADSELKSKLTEDHANLLASAGFDRQAYLNWVISGERV